MLNDLADRSVVKLDGGRNGQIEYLLKQAVQRRKGSNPAAILPPEAPPPTGT